MTHLVFPHLFLFLFLFQDAGVPLPPPVPRVAARRRHRDDGQERGHRVGAQPAEVQVPGVRRGGGPAGGRGAGECQSKKNFDENRAGTPVYTKKNWITHHVL